jgi:hypothetical protein
MGVIYTKDFLTQGPRGLQCGDRQAVRLVPPENDIRITRWLDRPPSRAATEYWPLRGGCYVITKS